MTLTAETLLQRLDDFSDVAGKPARYVVALSGGLDSTVLTHLLASGRDQHATDIVAVHIDHSLQTESPAWRAACEEFARRLGIEFVDIQVEVDKTSGRGPEASAREARYAAFREFIRTGDWLLSAHHKDDQAETLLLNLMRGSGPAGLAGIGAIQPFAAGWLVRPLLDVSRDSLLDYATSTEVAWIDDPSNQDRAFDRNFLRHEVLPKLAARWPDVAGRLRRSANLAGEAADLLAELAAIDLAAAGGKPRRMALDKLRGLSSARQRNLLRYAIRQVGLPVPGSRVLHSIVADLIPARDDAQPLVAWPGGELRRYRNALYISATNGPAEVLAGRPVAVAEHVALGPGNGVLSFVPGANIGLSESVTEHGLELRFRAGGEDFRPAGQTHTRKLKKLLQEEGVLPWMRDRLPLLFSDGRLVAVADLWIAADAASEPGTGVRWSDAPEVT